MQFPVLGSSELAGRRTGSRGGKGTRRRRTAEEARRLILDAAERRLREGGPGALRLQDIARDAGIAHPTILHHFESRDGLIQALLLRGMDRLESALLAVLETAPPTEETARAVTERIFATLGDAGHARLLAWRALEADAPEPDTEEPVLRRLTDLVHERRATTYGAVSREDSEFVIHLTAAAMLGDALFGPFIDHWLGHDSAPQTRHAFRSRFGRLLFEHLKSTEDDEP